MSKTISFHNGSAWSRGHNIRDDRYTNKQEHIDSTLTKNNVVLCDMPVRQAYEEIFGQAVEDYNAKQKRSDRKIDCYYDKIKADKRKHPAYECIVQIGDRSDTGNSAELEKQVLIKFAEEWDKRNPNLRLIGAYIHCDEPNGTIHMHCDYIPVARCSKGMKVQNSLVKALEQQGFKFENVHQTAQIAWQERERAALTSLCCELGIDAKHNQGISEDRKHLSKSEYIKAKQQQQAQIEEELKPLREKFKKYENFEVSANDYSIDVKKKMFSKDKVTISVSDFEQMKEQANGYRLMKGDYSAICQEVEEEIQKQKEITKQLESEWQKIEEEKQNLEEKERVFEEEKYNFHQKEQELADREAEWVEDTKELYRKQREHKEVYDKLRTAEKQNSELESSNKFLKEETNSMNKKIIKLKAQLNGEFDRALKMCIEKFLDKMKELKSNNEKLESELIKEKEKSRENEKLTQQLKEKEKLVSDLTEERNLLKKAIQFSGCDLVAEYKEHQKKLKQQRKRGLGR